MSFLSSSGVWPYNSIATDPPPSGCSVVPVLKKHHRVREADPDEFEEDIIEDDLDESPPTPPSSLAGGNGKKGKDRSTLHAQVYSELSSVLSKSDFHLLSFTPSSRTLVSLIHATSRPELDSTLEIVAKWRSRGLAVPDSASQALLRKCCQAGVPERLLGVLRDRTTYGAQLVEVRDTDRVFRDLTAPNVSGEDTALLQQQVEQTRTLLDLIKFYIPAANDAVGPIATLSLTALLANSPLGGQQQLEDLKPLVKQVKAIGMDKVVETFREVNPKTGVFLVGRTKIVARELEKAGLVEDAKWFGELLEKVREYAPTAAAKE